MNLAALRSLLLALTLAACSQSEPVPEFETVTVDFRDSGPHSSVPLPARKPAFAAAAPAQTAEPPVASSRFIPNMPDFSQITACPNGITCQAFAN